MKFLRGFFVVVTATVFFVSCGDDDSKTEECDPPCSMEACEECVGGECVVVCEEGEECIGGECVDPSSLVCDPECDSDECEECVGGQCVVVCQADEECVDGVCIKKPTDLDGTLLQEAAASLDPGEWYTDFHEGASYLAWLSDEQVYSSEVISSVGGLMSWDNAAHNSSDFWAPIGAWDPVGKRAYWITDRTSGGQTTECVALISYDPGTHTFFRLPRVEDGGNWGSPHVYGRWALDVGRQKIYRRQGTDGGSVPGGTLWIFDIATEQWESQGYTVPWGDAIAMHEELGELIYMDSSGNIRAWNPDNNTTRDIGVRDGVTSRHAHAHYNWVRKEWCMAFGDSGNQMTLVDENSNIQEVTIPEEVRGGGTSSTSTMFYDPISGNYLYTHRRDTESKDQIWEYDPDTDTWLGPVMPPNWAPYHGYIPAPITDLNVVMFIHRDRGARLYKHSSLF